MGGYLVNLKFAYLHRAVVDEFQQELPTRGRPGFVGLTHVGVLLGAGVVRRTEVLGQYASG